MVMNPNTGGFGGVDEFGNFIPSDGGSGGGTGGGSGTSGGSNSTPTITPTPTNTETAAGSGTVNTSKCVREYKKNVYGKKYPKILKTIEGQTYHNDTPENNAAVITYSDGSTDVKIAKPSMPNVPIPDWELISSTVIVEEVDSDLCGVSTSPTPTPTITLSVPITPTPAPTVEYNGLEYRIIPFGQGGDAAMSVRYFNISTNEWDEINQDGNNTQEILVCSGHVPTVTNGWPSPTGFKCSKTGQVAPVNN